jgi:hypothetical protein
MYALVTCTHKCALCWLHVTSDTTLLSCTSLCSHLCAQVLWGPGREWVPCPPEPVEGREACHGRSWAGGGGRATQDLSGGRGERESVSVCGLHHWTASSSLIGGPAALADEIRACAACVDLELGTEGAVQRAAALGYLHTQRLAHKLPSMLQEGPLLCPVQGSLP